MPFLHGVEVLQISDGVRPIQAVSSSIIGIVGTAPYADAAKFPLDTPVLITSPTAIKDLVATLPANSLIDVEGTLPIALKGLFDQVKTPVVVVRVDVNADAALQRAEVVGAADERSGVYAFLAAKAMIGYAPKILIATGFTHQVPAGGGANAVVAALKVVADKLRAIVVADGPNDTDADALAKVLVEAGERVYHVDPHVKVLDRTGVYVARPASAHVAGVIARTDQDQGFWWSPSNHELLGVVGLGRPIEFALSDTSASSNVLNEGAVATIVAANGYRLWGNRTKATDPNWAFLSVRRTADMIYEALEASYLWAMDRPMSPQLLIDVVGSVEAYLASLKARGAILGGKAWADPELNTEETLKAGQLFVNFDIEPPAPVERLTFMAQRNGGYYAELVTTALAQIA
jgi:phage tail sheath protein FI